MTKEIDYKLKSAIIEAELSLANKENQGLQYAVKELKEKLEPYDDLFPVIRSMADASRLQRLLGLAKTITEEQLVELGV